MSTSLAIATVALTWSIGARIFNRRPVTARELLPVMPLGSVLALPLILRARESMQIPETEV